MKDLVTEELKAKRIENERLRKEIQEKKARLADLNNDISHQEKELARRSQELLQIRDGKMAELVSREDVVIRRENKVIEMEPVLSEREKNLASRENQVRELREQVAAEISAIKKDQEIIVSEKECLSREATDIESTRRVLVSDMTNFAESKRAVMAALENQKREYERLSDQAQMALENARAAESRAADLQEAARAQIEAAKEQRDIFESNHAEIAARVDSLAAGELALKSKVEEIARKESKIAIRETTLTQRERNLLAFREEVFKSAAQRGVKAPEGL